MRTKTLLLTAAIGAAGIATSMAQVYSVNAVGYVNKSIPLNTSATLTYALLANPLNGTNNNINTIIPTVPDGTQLFKFTGGLFADPETFITGLGWVPGAATLSPGQGFFIAFDNAQSVNPTVVTFVGEVPQGNLTNQISNGYTLAASIVPQTGALTSALGLNPTPDSQVFVWNATLQRYDDPYTFIEGVGWIPSDPTIPVAEGFFFLNTSPAFSWGRTFSVN